ncbi:ABC transporter ATP-binding protein [Alicyclobacillus cellulosilyticus]|uniref:ABC transporter ATP-binding protein n=1 Tax=Alicyclobacillus cellulosilyticus TaxID=1003997 RepID=A0A917K7C0_9BACL|nr:ABC transporter ATP-binding protein [Alicyclobacillus cellulosilyticus]GGJ02668.1 ABC transporter ATP-binding protein [Alicyclobacillus cellulosilyticus]
MTQTARSAKTAAGEPAVAVEGLKVLYGERVALAGVSFEVPAGTCFGLLGPNGAGKSTTMKVLCGLVRPQAGWVRLFGREVSGGHADAGRIGYVPQAITLYDKLTAQENLALFGRLSGLRGAALAARMETVLTQVGLADRAREPVARFSGGMKRRLNIAAALLHEPELVIMDEPTVGVDPQSRYHIFNLVREMKTRGVTVIYCTHYMEEAEALCDHIAILDHGAVIARGPLSAVLREHAEPAVYLELDEPGYPEAPAGVTPPVVTGASPPQPDGDGWLYRLTAGHDALAVLEAVAGACRGQGLRVRRLEVVRPALERVFLKLTGTSLRDEA